MGKAKAKVPEFDKLSNPADIFAGWDDHWDTQIEGDALKRTKREKEADDLYAKEYQDAQMATSAKLLAFAAPYLFAQDDHVRIIAQDTQQEKLYPVANGPYMLDALDAMVAECVEQKNLDAITERSREVRSTEALLGYAEGGEQYALGRTTRSSIIVNHKGQTRTVALTRPHIHGMTYRYGKSDVHPVAMTTTDVELWRAGHEAHKAAWSPPNTWCIDVPSLRVEEFIPRSAEIEAMLKAQMEPLREVNVYGVSARWLRYYSDGTSAGQKNALRLAPYPGGGMRPLLYDGPAYAVGLTFGENVLAGRVFVNLNGEFLCSDWCQREVDKNEGNIDLITGKNMKHTLLTWCAGPGMSQFMSNLKDRKSGKSVSAVRRYKKPVPKKDNIDGYLNLLMIRRAYAKQREISQKTQWKDVPAIIVGGGGYQQLWVHAEKGNTNHLRVYRLHVTDDNVINKISVETVDWSPDSSMRRRMEEIGLIGVFGSGRTYAALDESLDEIIEKFGKVRAVLP